MMFMKQDQEDNSDSRQGGSGFNAWSMNRMGDKGSNPTPQSILPSL